MHGTRVGGKVSAGEASGQRGASLLEVVIAIGLLGILIAGFVPAMMGATRSMISVDERETAKNLAESQMEYVKGQPYETVYHPSASYSQEFPGFVVDDPITVAATGGVRDDNIQSFTVVVRRGGLEITRLTGFKVK